MKRSSSGEHEHLHVMLLARLKMFPSNQTPLIIDVPDICSPANHPDHVCANKITHLNSPLLNKQNLCSVSWCRLSGATSADCSTKQLDRRKCSPLSSGFSLVSQPLPSVPLRNAVLACNADRMCQQIKPNETHLSSSLDWLYCSQHRFSTGTRWSNQQLPLQLPLQPPASTGRSRHLWNRESEVLLPPSVWHRGQQRNQIRCHWGWAARTF